MNEIEIKKHNFNEAKDRIKSFSELKEKDLDINTVCTSDGLFGFRNHKVTGSELNDRLEAVKENFIKINGVSNKIIKEFGQIYNALDVLDKEYITSIVANVKAIKKTSDDIKIQQGTLEQHNKELQNQHNKLDIQQIEIKKNVENISKIVRALKAFREKLESYEHLNDIDNLWENLENAQKYIDEINRGLDKQKQKLENLEEKSQEQGEAIYDLNSFRYEVSLMDHLMEIDEIWQQVNEQKQYIDIMQQVEQDISDSVETANSVIEILTKKIKYAYWIAGSSLSLTIILFILFFIKVI